MSFLEDLFLRSGNAVIVTLRHKQLHFRTALLGAVARFLAINLTGNHLTAFICERHFFVVAAVRFDEALEVRLDDRGPFCDAWSDIRRLVSWAGKIHWYI